jgi:hypothetical protein
VGCLVEDNEAETDGQNSELTTGAVTEIKEDQKVEVEAEELGRVPANGVVIEDSIVCNDDYEYYMEVPEAWFGKVSYIVDGSTLTLYHISTNPDAMEVNPEIIYIDVEAGTEIGISGELLEQGGGSSYIYYPRMDFPYEMESEDGKEYAEFLEDIESVLNTFWVNEELLSDETLENPFAVAGIQDVEYFSQFFYAFQSLVDSEFTAEDISFAFIYPLTVKTENGTVEINNEADLDANIDAIFTDNVINAVKAQSFDMLFANYQGVMVGNGQVWFGVTGNEEYFVEAINP